MSLPALPVSESFPAPPVSVSLPEVPTKFKSATGGGGGTTPGFNISATSRRPPVTVLPTNEAVASVEFSKAVRISAAVALGFADA